MNFFHMADTMLEAKSDISLPLFDMYYLREKPVSTHGTGTGSTLVKMQLQL